MATGTPGLWTKIPEYLILLPVNDLYPAPVNQGETISTEQVRQISSVGFECAEPGVVRCSEYHEDERGFWADYGAGE